MSVDLTKIRKGRSKMPPRVMVYSFDGIGKTTFANGAEDAFFIDANKGTYKLDVFGALEANSWEETNEITDAIIEGKILCKSVVLDAVTDMEAFSHAHLFRGTTVTKYEGGYGKGDDLVVSEWRVYLSKLERIWHMGKTIIILGHARVKNFADPQGPAYDRFELACRPQLAGMLRQWCDYVFFAREEVVIASKKNEHTRGVTTGVRWAYTRRTPAYDAKARGTLLFPERFPLSWSEFQRAVKEDDLRSSGIDLQRSIDEMVAEIADQAFTDAVRDYIKQYPAGIVEAHNRVAAKLDEVRRARGAGQPEKAA